MPSLRPLFLVSLLLAGCADNGLKAGRTLIESGKTQEGLAQLQADTRKAPTDVLLRQYYYTERQLAITRWLADAKAALATGDLTRAQARLDDITQTDPHNAQMVPLRRALERGQGYDTALKAAQVALAAHRDEEAERSVQAVLKRAPDNAAALALLQRIHAEREKTAQVQKLAAEYDTQKVSLEFQNAPMRSVFDALSRESGLNFVFAPGVPLDSLITLFAKNTSIANAVTLLVEGNRLKYRVINEHSLLIAPEVPPAPPALAGGGEVMRAFYLTNVDPKKVGTLLQSLTAIKNLYVDDQLNLIIVRGNPQLVDTAARLIAMVDKAQPEVMLDVEVLEVSNDLVRNLGIQYPNQFTLLNVPPTASSVTTPTGTTVTTPTTTPLTLASLKGITLSKIAINNPALNLQDDSGDVKLLANPQIRVKNRDDAHIQIGEKVPVFNSSITPTGVISNSVSYLDVGLKLDVKPQVMLDNDVQIQLALEVSSILNQVNNNGTLAYQIGTRNATTTLRLADGETQIMAGLISDQDRSTANRIPGLGELPLLGRLFSNHLDSRHRTEIILLITPHVLRNLNLDEGGQTQFAVGEGGGASGAPETVPVFTSAAIPSVVPPPAPVPTSPASPQQPPTQPGTAVAPMLPPGFKFPPGFKLPPGVSLPPGMSQP